MGNKLYQVGEVARIAGTTIRALHHYDSIGLLKPTGRSDGGYRLYSEDDLLRLQQIYIGRSLGMSLEQVRRILDDPGFDRRRALLEQREKLVTRLNETHSMIAALDAAVRSLDKQGENKMNPKELFEGFDPSAFEAEVKDKWGDTDAYREASSRTARYTQDDWARMRADEDALMQEFASELKAGRPSNGEAALALAERHRLHIDRWFYPCSHAAHAGLAEMYLGDERFMAYFERYTEGLAKYVVEAIRANASAG